MGLKARVKATGDIFDIEGVSLRLTGKVLSTFGLDEVEIVMPDLTPDYWTRLEHQAAIAAIQGILSNPNIAYKDISIELLCNHWPKKAIEIAHALVEKMKEERK